ncbi:YrdB family protein [Bacillus sp. S/N-304-OC-R1]|uniref:YrdB family protein n=1 Tax=Bacillus sp. S/N-304-OC-R1 TaxID=2758034 RepID=UPI001C8E870E|nr:YrdB family protein [Bacillus sp. S/N-304-OC-R1]MBY0122906.1 YrdB family protein [Bacillus sp. S/N-304-OC-R1]
MLLIKNANLLLRLMLELSVLISIGYWGFQYKSSFMIKFGLGIGVPILVIIVWGTFIAPNSAYQLPLTLRIIMELIVFGLGGYALYSSGHQSLFKTFTILVCINMILLLYWKQ